MGRLFWQLLKIMWKYMLILMVIHAIIGALLNPYTLNSWLVFLDKAPTVTWWQGALLGFAPIVGEATMPAAFVTWILMLVLV